MLGSFPTIKSERFLYEDFVSLKMRRPLPNPTTQRAKDQQNRGTFHLPAQPVPTSLCTPLAFSAYGEWPLRSLHRLQFITCTSYYSPLFRLQNSGTNQQQTITCKQGVRKVVRNLPQGIPCTLKGILHVLGP